MNHFSHIHASPMFLNPGMTGLINSDFRFISNTKSQWQFFDKGYQTTLASASAYNLPQTKPEISILLPEKLPYRFPI